MPGIGGRRKDQRRSQRARRRAEEALRRSFTFREYIEIGHLNPTWGYYGSGRVQFGGHDVGFRTGPIKLSPAYGSLVAANACRVFEALPLTPGQPFTLLECGGGDGVLARDFLDYARARAGQDRDGAWGRFYGRLEYVICEGSPSLAERQRAASAHHPGKLRVLVGNASRLASATRPGELRGMALSHELLDDLGHHKVVFARSRPEATAVLCVPRIEAATLATLVDAPRLRRLREQSDALVSACALSPPRPGELFLPREQYVSLRDALPREAEDRLLGGLSWKELHVPASAIPELGEHLTAYRSYYAALLGAGRDEVMTLYINTDAARYVEGLAHAFAAGCFVTIDYGDLVVEAVKRRLLACRLRLYGPGARELMQQYAYHSAEADPYAAHGKLNVTFTEDFEMVRRAGERAGCRTLWCGTEDVLFQRAGDGGFERVAEHVLAGWMADPSSGLVPPRSDEERAELAARLRQVIADYFQQQSDAFMALVQVKGDVGAITG